MTINLINDRLTIIHATYYILHITLLHITYYYTSPTYNNTFQTPGAERDLEKEGVGNSG